MTTVRTTESLPVALNSNAAVERQERLALRVRSLRTKASTGSFDRALLMVGGILIPVGVLFVILGWVGASRTPLVFEQIPYLISGGALGLSLVFAGGFTYFAYWQSVRVRDARTHQRELLLALRRVEARIAMLETGDTAGSTSTNAAKGGYLVATQTGSMVHRPDCTVVAGRDKLKKVPADGAGMVPCKICDPLS